MDISNEILARLQNGESVENIAADLTKSINTANEAYTAQKEAEEKAKREALDQAALIADKRDAVIDFLDSICNICATWGVAEDLVNDLEDISDEDISDIVNAIDQAIPFITKYVDLQKELHTCFQPKKVDNCDCAECHAPEAKVDPIESFLNTFVR